MNTFCKFTTANTHPPTIHLQNTILVSTINKKKKRKAENLKKKSEKKEYFSCMCAAIPSLAS